MQYFLLFPMLARRYAFSHGLRSGSHSEAVSVPNAPPLFGPAFWRQAMKANLLFGIGVLLFTGARAFSQVLVTVDENGNGSAIVNGATTPLPSAIVADPTWGGPA